MSEIAGVLKKVALLVALPFAASAWLSALVDTQTPHTLRGVVKTPHTLRDVGSALFPITLISVALHPKPCIPTT